MTEQFSNFAVSSLTAPISANQTTISVASAVNFPTQGSFHLVVQSFESTTGMATSAPEIMVATSVAGTQFTVTRGAENTQAIAFAAGAQVALVATAEVMRALQSGGGGGSGTVTNVSVATANGVSGVVSNPTTTPSITLTLGAITPTSVAASGAVSGSNLSGTNTGDQTNITGNAGTVSTINGLVTAGTNIAITGTGTAASPYNISSSGSGSGTVTSVSVTTANGVSASVANPTTTPALSFTLGAITPSSIVASGTISGSNLSGTNTGDQTTISGNAGTAAKWQTARLLAGNSVDGSANVPFANKFIVQGTTDTGLSGAQFLGALATGIVKNTTSTGVLSIAAAGTDYEVPLTFSTGLTRSTNTITVNTSQNISTLSNLTSNGLIKTSGGTGALSIATAGTDYQAPITLTTTGSSGAATLIANTLNIPQYSGGGSGTVTTVSVVSANGFAGTVATATTTPAITISTSVTGLLKGNGTAVSAATAGTDYSLGTSALATGILKSTTSTGALTIAVAADFPTLNQSTTGSAATLTTPRAIGIGGTTGLTATGVNFDGSAAINPALTGTLILANGGLGITSGTSGGVPYFSSTSTVASSTLLAANAPIIGGGAGVAPSSGTRSGNTTKFATVSGTLTAGNLATFDASGNVIDSGSATPIMTGLAVGGITNAIPGTGGPFAANSTTAGSNLTVKNVGTSTAWTTGTDTLTGTWKNLNNSTTALGSIWQRTV